MTARGLIVAAPRSGSGKTTVTLALLAALRRRGIAVHAAKAGPDYIDPAFHAAATGRPSLNLDSWAMKPALLDALMGAAAGGAEMLVIEGAMGLFDGIESAPRRSGSTADLAARFGLPVLLVVDVSGQSQSAAALVRGFAMHDPEVRICGVVLNRVGSERNRTLVSGAIAVLGIPILGSIPREESLGLPERHLGLVQASEHGDLDARFARFADLAECHLDLDEIITLATAPSITSRQTAAAIRPPGMRIALAQDDAFTFVYPH
ncbi:MAG TPA: cobyrinate a,c-diamide synthase, partial [Usitatibacter sp.]|nr:cobyrinate a,c-diamide synthase [Usitatibacter sp.]